MGKEELSKFIKALEVKGLLKFNVEEFDVRFKIQKYVLLAKALGIDLGYTYNLYIRGPYSTGLTDDYYSLDEEYSNADPTEYLPKIEKLYNLVNNKDVEWLELAGTLFSLYNTYNEEGLAKGNKEAIINHAISIKSWASFDYAKNVFNELEKYEFIS
ncbi:MAG: hypothetical protein GYA60_01525 [Candidatus Methanofastidiosa archaeon]|nr:hypothetical protein [Candidatus Methanofastidiosa archaeon]